MRCCGCDDEYPNGDGPTHAYMLSSPGCWAAYCKVLALEYENRSYRSLHRFSVDSYAVQHPGEDSPQSRNSVGIHLSRLALILEWGWPIGKANGAMLEITSKKTQYPWLTPPQSRGLFTVKTVLNARNPEEHIAAVEQWAKSAWQAWQPHHDTVLKWLEILPGLTRPSIS